MPAKSYETAIAYASEAYFLGNDKPEEPNDHVTLISFIYCKDELRVVKDIQVFLKKRG